MAFEGMDVDQVSNIYSQMTNLSTQLQGITTAMPRLVSELESAWQGPDARMFAQQWPAHQAQLNNALTGLEEMRAHTQSNLQAQQQASNTY